jgi:large subunit ribosomal protein L3
VDVVGTSKGKGFAGGMKRHNFSGQPATHGTERKHRSPGSISSHGANLGRGTIKKGKRMAGHMGHVRCTRQNLELIEIDADKNLMLIKGNVPGANNGYVIIRSAKSLDGGRLAAKLAARARAAEEAKASKKKKRR